MAQATTAAPATTSAWSPLSIPRFRMLWIATLASNVGTWMHDVGAGWLMTTLSPLPIMVALVQTATSLPVFLLALPAGALSDIVDRRRYLIAVQLWMALVAATLGILTVTGITSAWLLVAMTSAMSAGTAMMLPAWAAITPELVPRETLQPAIALNSLGINLARAIGPALAGVIVSLAGTGAVFLLNALSYLGVIVVLRGWQRRSGTGDLPAERFAGAMRAGLRFAGHAPELHAAVIRGFSFFLFASAAWALLPLVARHLVDGGPRAFGLLVASLGAGAVGGALLLPRLRMMLSRDALVAAATLVYAGAMLAMAAFDRLLLLTPAMGLAGMAWITVLSSLQAAAQMALPDWVRSRGLALFMSVFMGSMAAGSLVWGAVAGRSSVSVALVAAAAGLVVATAASWRMRISGFEQLALSPSMHWPAPVTHEGITHERGPVLVTIVYEADPAQAPRFVDAITRLGRHRRRDGAFGWGLFEQTGQPHRYIEIFRVESWLEHLRQHERVTEADRALQTEIRGLLRPGTAPAVTHFVAPGQPGNTHTAAPRSERSP